MILKSSLKNYRYCVILNGMNSDSAQDEWCQSQFGNKIDRWKVSGSFTYYFANKNDAILFELTWG